MVMLPQKAFRNKIIKNLSAVSNALHILKQCIENFNLRYQRPLYALFRHDPHLPPDPDPPYQHYTGAP